MDSPLLHPLPTSNFIQVGGARDIKLENIMLARVRRGDIFVPRIFVKKKQIFFLPWKIIMEHNR